ncbi:MAG: phenylalanine--tRNA ligase subunit beta [bacterium]|nr:phenylalanine--tRNA ligase subunit beta [bacterium]
MALAGVMGGLNSEIREDTTDVVLECAYFDPVHVRRTAKSLGMSTDSSRRFERGCDPNQVPLVAERAIGLMQDWGGGEVWQGGVDAYPRTITPVEISFRPERASRVIGRAYDHRDVEDILTRLGCEVKSGGDTWTVKAPTYRPDLEREIDLIEEVVRVHGYDQIPTEEVSKVVLAGQDHPDHQTRRQVEDILVGAGFQQCLSLAMWNPEPRLDPPGLPAGVPVANPVTDEMRFFQGSVLPPLFRAAAANFERGDRDLRLFETTRVFREGTADDPRTWERRVVAGLLTGRRMPSHWSSAKDSVDFFDLKAVLELLGSRLTLDNCNINCYALDTLGLLTGEMLVGGERAGGFGIWPKTVCGPLDLDADVAWFELELSVLAKHRLGTARFAALPRFPLAWRDLAVVVDTDVEYRVLDGTIRQAAGECLTSIAPFDVFVSDKVGLGKKSVAMRLEFLHPDRSLDAAEVDGWMQQVIQALAERHGAALR